MYTLDISWLMLFHCLGRVLQTKLRLAPFRLLVLISPVAYADILLLSRLFLACRKHFSENFEHLISF